MIAIGNIVLRLSIKFAARGDVIVIASKSIAISHKTPSEHRLPLYECVGTYETGNGGGTEGRGEGAEGSGDGGRGHKTSKRFIKYRTGEHCYDTSMQILFCVCTRGQSMTRSPHSPFIRRISSSLRSSIENSARERERESSGKISSELPDD